MKEKDIWRCAAALYGGRVLLYCTLAATVWLIGYCLNAAFGSPLRIGLPLLWASMFASTIVVAAFVGLAYLPNFFDRRSKLALAPNASQLESALRRRLLAFCVALIPVAIVLGGARVFAEETPDRVPFFLSQIPPKDMFFVAWGLLQGTVYAYVLVRVIRIPSNLFFFAMYFSVVASNSRYAAWWGLVGFLVVAVCYTLWKKLNRDLGDSERNTRRDHAVQSPTLETKTSWVTRRADAKWRAGLVALDQLRGTRVSSVLRLIAVTAPQPHYPFVVGAIVVMLLSVRAVLSGGGVAYVGVLFASTYALFVAPSPLLPTLMLPVGLDRGRIANALLVNLLIRDLRYLLPAITIAFAWALLNNSYGIWMPFSRTSRLPWVAEDWLLTFPGTSAIVFGLIVLGIASAARLVVSATPAIMNTERRWSLGRVFGVFVFGGFVIGVELLLHRYFAIAWLRDSFSARLLAAALVVTPLAALIYHVLARNAWQRANIPRIVTAIREHEKRVSIPLSR
jgi:hypothetical protein